MAKVRVYELAKELRTESKVLLEILNELGIFVRSANSTIEASDTQALRAAYASRDGVIYEQLRRGARRRTPPTTRTQEMTRRAVPAKQPVQRARTTPAGSSHASVEDVLIDLALHLHRSEVDAVELRHPIDKAFYLRVDKILDERAPFWLTMWAPRIEDLSAPLTEIPWKTLPEWRLPLASFTDPQTQLPGVLVHQLADVRSSVEVARAIVEARLADRTPPPTLTAEECEPAEANRRLGARVLVDRRGAGPQRFAETTCMKCGQPLSDPTSVRLGIGPECRSKLGVDVMRALGTTGPSAPHLVGARRPRSWAALIQHRLAPLADSSR